MWAPEVPRSHHACSWQSAYCGPLPCRPAPRRHAARLCGVQLAQGVRFLTGKLPAGFSAAAATRLAVAAAAAHLGCCLSSLQIYGLLMHACQPGLTYFLADQHRIVGAARPGRSSRSSTVTQAVSAPEV